MKATAIDHICIAVRDLDKARVNYEQVLGLKPDGEYEAPLESIRVVRYYLGEVALELMEPTNDDCEVARFLKTRGEGLFLISYRVDDVVAGLKELHDKGHKTIDQKPRDLKGNRYAFIMPPEQMSGVLTEIVDSEFENLY